LFNCYKGPKHYRPYSVSFNNKDGGKPIINRYAKGSKRFKSSDQSKSLNNPKIEDQSDEKWDNVETNIDLLYNYESETNYQQKQIRLATNWKIVQDDIYNSILDNEEIPNNPSCFNCNNVAILKCMDCGPKIFYCNNCFNHFHSVINLFHHSIYIKNFKVKTNEIRLPQLCKGKCEHSLSRILTIHLNGMNKIFIIKENFIY
jgi:hypothetical protein